jgi:hypothetical protein
MPRSDIKPYVTYVFFLSQETTFWTPCSDAVCGGCCSVRLQQLHLVNRDTYLRTTVAQLQGKAEVRHITVVCYIESPSLCARDTRSFTYCMKTSYCRCSWCLSPFLSLTENVCYLWPGLKPNSVINHCTHRVDLASALSTTAPGIFILFL